MPKLLLALIAYLPFQIALNPLAEVDLASIRVLILTLFFWWLISLLITRKIKQAQIGYLGFYLFLFLMFALLSVFLADNQAWGMRKIIFFASIFPLYFLVVNLVDSFKKIKQIIWALFLGASLMAIIGLVQFLAQFFYSFEQIYHFWAENIVFKFSGNNFGTMLLSYPSWLVDVGFTNWIRAFSLFSDPHMLSFYLGLILPLGVALYFISSKYKKLILFFNSLLFLTLLLTFTRGAYLAIIVTFVLMSFLIWYKFKQRTVAFILSLSLLVFLIPGTPVAYRFYTVFNDKEESNLGRLEMWQQASKIGQKNLMTGVGLGNYSLEIKPELGYRNPATAHNLYLDIFSEMGLLALAAWLLMFGVGFRLAYRSLINKNWLALGLLGSLTYYFCHSVFETAIYHPVILPLLMLILGLIYVNYNNKQGSR